MLFLQPEYHFAMTKDLVKLLIAEYQQLVTKVDFIHRQVDFMDGQNYVLAEL